MAEASPKAGESERSLTESQWIRGQICSLVGIPPD